MFRNLRSWTVALAAILALAPSPAAAQETDLGIVTLDRLFSADFRGGFFGPARWLDDGDAYTTLEQSEDGQGRDLVKYDTRTGERSLLIRASSLIPSDGSGAIGIQGYEWSPDGTKLLIFTNSKRVWRRNTRGDYWVYDMATGALRKLGGDAEGNARRVPTWL
jgi:dipeptidyl-peptidase-4